MDDKPSLSAWECISLPLAFARITLSLITAVLRAPFRGKGGAPTFKRYVLYEGMRSVVESTTLRKYQAINPSTVESYTAFVKKKGLGPNISKLPDGSLGCWIGDKAADLIVLWFHGGGFAYMAGQEYMKFLSSIVSEASAKNLSIAAFILQYSVAPKATYPRQLEQAVGTVKFLTEELGKPYSNLLIGGDSAGSSLTAAVLAHLSHPHPSIPPLRNNGQSFRGALFLSSWLKFDQSSQSFSRNSRKDCLGGPGLRKWAKAYMGHAPADFYNEPLEAPADWWQDIAVGHILILAGEDEILLDDALQFVQKLKQHNANKVVAFISTGECHNPPVSDRQLGLYHREGEGAMERRLHQWILDRI
ncbi:Alpha/Beta hydrolase protein [Whalleya microplaca]|nr:Alpha/Beta hydrolase protein [Whalleya microplaca]